MKALLCYNDKDFRIEEIEKPAIADEEMLIELLYCGLCGSEMGLGDHQPADTKSGYRANKGAGGCNRPDV